jgi:hypothetical protein
MSDFDDEIEAMLEDVHAGLATRTIGVKHNAPGAFAAATGVRALTPTTDSNISALYSVREAEDSGGGRVAQHTYRVMRSDLSALPNERSQVSDGATIFQVSSVELECDGKEVVLRCRTTKKAV